MTDSYDLDRFVSAQSGGVFEQALAELVAGRKRTHWMWFVFPQVDGLGHSSTTKRYAIKSVREAYAYLAHPVLGPRLLQCVDAVLAVDGPTMHDVFGSPDDMKLKSSATLFAAITPMDSPFDRLLNKHYAGDRDERTIAIIMEMATRGSPPPSP